MIHKKGFVYLFIVISCVLIAIIITFIFWSGLKLSNRPSQAETLKLVVEEIEIPYPMSWQVLLTSQGNHGDGEVFGLISGPVDPFMPTANIVLAHKSSAMDNMTIEDWGDNRIKSQFGDYTNISLSSFSSPYLTGIVREYLLPSSSVFYNENTHCKDLYFVYLDNLFDFSFCSVDEKWNKTEVVFEEIMQNVKPLENK